MHNIYAGIENVIFPPLWHCSSSADGAVIEIPTVWIKDGIPVKKILIVKEGSIILKINEKKIDVTQLGIANQFVWNQGFCNSLEQILSCLQLCKGHCPSSYADIAADDSYASAIWNNVVTGELIEGVSCNKCDRILSLTSVSGTCPKCVKHLSMVRKIHNQSSTCNGTGTAHTLHPVDTNSTTNDIAMKINYDCDSDDDEMYLDYLNEITVHNDLHKDLMDILLKIMPACTPEFRILLDSQIKNSSNDKDPRYRKWSPNVISICLSMYIRSPQAYKDLKASNTLILPSGSLLQYYKNSVNQKPGFIHDNLLWMCKEADRCSIPSTG